MEIVPAGEQVGGRQTHVRELCAIRTAAMVWSMGVISIPHGLFAGIHDVQ